jgi:hypothetical protein
MAFAAPSSLVDLEEASPEGRDRLFAHFGVGDRARDGQLDSENDIPVA